MTAVIMTILSAIFFVPAYYMALRHNLHMFQQNGYKNTEQLRWLKKNLKRQWLLLISIVFGVLRIFVDHIAFGIFLFFHFYLIYLVFRAMKRLNTKKKLVFTARVKRLMATEFILSAAALALTAILAGWEYLTAAMLFVLSVQFCLNIIANIINRPMELAVNRYYINDAKRKLKSVQGLKIIGVTGSYGKTSVKFFLGALLKTRFNTLITPESYNTPMGVVKTVRASLKPVTEVFVCEMGARHVHDIKELCDIVHPQMGVITAIGPQHLETFKSQENIVKTKFELADALPSGGKLFLNGDNDFIREKGKEYSDTVYYSTCGDAGTGYRAGNIKLSWQGCEFDVTTPSGESEHFSMRLVGSVNVINVTAAIAVSHELGIPLSELKLPVRRLQPVAHRMELKPKGDYSIIDDAYNSNPEGSKAAVETLKLFEGERILITPGMVELGAREAELNEKFGGYAAACCDHILLVGKKRSLPIREGILKAGFDEKKCLSFDRFEEAFTYAMGIKTDRHKYILLENDLPDNYQEV
ncbi:MAG: UDP-N-acetylmuramoyl-tripeptide--D-alanyl-D-alanine ligase [Lachnospiraceae bacterium]|nr:UDP-N-acetylmuramoyl-tripeptide--D-alanyl-D-alanine ligase [Lachnospiraceae bacterium]